VLCVSDTEASWDVIVIGGGPPGEIAAQYAVDGGLSAAIVEGELLGGECSYWACMPSKALLRPVELMAAAKAMPGVSQALTGDLDVAAVLARRDDFTHRHDDSSQVDWAEGAGIDVVRGHGRLDGPRAVRVERADGSTQRLEARHAVVVATGTSAAVPDIPGLREAQPWTSRDVTNVREVPRRVAILGGGTVAVEAATWLRGLGAEQVTVIERGPRLLGKAEPFAGELLGKRFTETGVDVHLGSGIAEVRRDAPRTTEEGRPRGTEVTVVLADGTELRADELLVAAGRRPRTDDIGLDSVGLEAGGYLSTDDSLTVEGVDGQWLYAVGDVTGRALLTHMGKYQARVCGDVIAARAAGRPTEGPRFRAGADAEAVPQVTFTDPQIASVGRTVEQARDAGLEARVVDYDIASIAGASLTRDDYVGQARLVVDEDTATLVGATFVGADVAELLHSATVAVVGKVPLETLWHAVPSYPTISEVWLRLLETWRSGG
jgi:pyruvate/2-oxoglutarate dehydrogenase complex dihydrolipoamide dehydrogenase (E3) component